MIIEVSAEQFTASCAAIAREAILFATYSIAPAFSKQCSESAPPTDSGPGAESVLRLWTEDVPAQVNRILIVTAGGELLFLPTTAFDESFVLSQLPMATATTSLCG